MAYFIVCIIHDAHQVIGKTNDMPARVVCPKHGVCNVKKLNKSLRKRGHFLVHVKSQLAEKLKI